MNVEWIYIQVLKNGRIEDRSNLSWWTASQEQAHCFWRTVALREEPKQSPWMDGWHLRYRFSTQISTWLSGESLEYCISLTFAAFLAHRLLSVGQRSLIFDSSRESIEVMKRRKKVRRSIEKGVKNKEREGKRPTYIGWDLIRRSRESIPFQYTLFPFEQRGKWMSRNVSPNSVRTLLDIFNSSLHVSESNNNLLPNIMLLITISELGAVQRGWLVMMKWREGGKARMDR